MSCHGPLGFLRVYSSQNLRPFNNSLFFFLFSFVFFYIFFLLFSLFFLLYYFFLSFVLSFFFFLELNLLNIVSPLLPHPCPYWLGGLQEKEKKEKKKRERKTLKTIISFFFSVFFLFSFFFSFLVFLPPLLGWPLLLKGLPLPLLGWVVSPPLLVGGLLPSCWLGGPSSPFSVWEVSSTFFWLGGPPFPFSVWCSPFRFLVGWSSLTPFLVAVSLLLLGWAVSSSLFVEGSPSSLLGWVVSPPLFFGGLPSLVGWGEPPPLFFWPTPSLSPCCLGVHPPVVWGVSPPFLVGPHYWFGGLPFSLFVGKKREKRKERKKEKQKDKYRSRFSGRTC